MRKNGKNIYFSYACVESRGSCSAPKYTKYTNTRWGAKMLIQPYECNNPGQIVMDVKWETNPGDDARMRQSYRCCDGGALYHGCYKKKRTRFRTIRSPLELATVETEELKCDDGYHVVDVKMRSGYKDRNGCGDIEGDECSNQSISYSYRCCKPRPRLQQVSFQKPKVQDKKEEDKMEEDKMEEDEEDLLLQQLSSQKPKVQDKKEDDKTEEDKTEEDKKKEAKKKEDEEEEDEEEEDGFLDGFLDFLGCSIM